jgi:hypothetical protein
VEGKRPTRPSAQRPGPGPLTNPTTRLRLHAQEDLRLLTRHARVRSRQTHPVKATPSLAPPPLNGRADSDDKPDVHPRAAPPSTGTHLVKGMRPTRPSAQRPGTGPLTTPTTRQRPHARLRLGCAPPRGPPSGTATGAHFKRAAYDLSTSDSFPRGSSNSHYPRAGLALTRRPPATSLCGSPPQRPARKTRIRDRKRITTLLHHCANVAFPLNLT